MNKDALIEKLLNLVKGQETPEGWKVWWEDHAAELATMLSRGDYLKLKPCQHAFQWLPILTSQKGAIKILQKLGITCEASNFYLKRYQKELHSFCQKQKKVQQNTLQAFKSQYPDLLLHYPQFSKALIAEIDPTDEIQRAATPKELLDCERKLGYKLPSLVRDFFLVTSGMHLSIGLKISLSEMFITTYHGKPYCVLGEFCKEADGDQLLLRSDEEVILYYSHEQDQIQELCSDMTELLEKKMVRYFKGY